MYPPVSRQQMIYFIQEQKANFQLQIRGENPLSACVSVRLEQDLVLDKELLNAIRKSLPHQIKFYIHPKYNKLVDEYSCNNNQDTYIKELYKQSMLNVDDQKYRVFEKEIFSILKNIYSEKLNSLKLIIRWKIIAQQQLFKYSIQKLDLQDHFLNNLPVEYPARCIYCNFNKCSDIRTYIGYILILKQKSPDERFKCPLCSYTHNKSYKQILNMEIQQYIYLDQNLLRRLLEHREYIYSKKFKYDGRSYMLEEFKKKNKIFKADVKKLSIHHNIEYIEYSKLNCVVSGQRLKIPLQLQKCPEKQYVDFNVFYDQLKQIGFDFKKGLILCMCQTCISQPIMSMNDIFYDEFFQIVLDKLELYERKNQTTQNKQIISLNTEDLLFKNQNQNNIMGPKAVLPRPGFQSIQTEEEFEIALDQFQRNQKNIEEFNLYQIQERTQIEITSQLKYLNQEPL